jgi:GTP-binding protein
LGELSSYGQGLDEKPRLVALNKTDLRDPSDDPAPPFRGERVCRISALTGAGLDGLVHAVWELLEAADD